MSAKGVAWWFAEVAGSSGDRGSEPVDAGHRGHHLTRAEVLETGTEFGLGEGEGGRPEPLDDRGGVDLAEEPQRQVPVLGRHHPNSGRVVGRDRGEHVGDVGRGPGGHEQSRHASIIATRRRSGTAPTVASVKIGINGSDQLARPDLGTIVEIASQVEADGFDSFWLAQTALVDAPAALGLIGTATETLTLGTAVVPTWPRHPHALAASALTAQAASNGRFVLGIGLSHRPVVESFYKMEWRKPVRHMLDYLDILLPLLETGSSNHEGEFFSYVGEGARPTTTPPKVMLAALGDQMLRVAGKRTDGTILWCVGPKTIEKQIKPAIDAAADEAGRPTPSIVCSLPVWVTDDPQSARDFVGQILSVYAELPSYRAMLDIEGVHGLAELSLIGSHDEVVDGINAIREAGATDFTAVVMGGNPDETAATRGALLAAR